MPAIGFDPPLDPGIERAVLMLQSAGIETFESCEGGEGHAYSEPTVRFHGTAAEGLRALAAAIEKGLPVAALRRVWPVIDGEPTGPWWELTFAGWRDGSLYPLARGCRAPRRITPELEATAPPS